MTETSVVQLATALEHKFKTWLIRSTGMKFNIWIKEIVFVTRWSNSNSHTYTVIMGASNYYGCTAGDCVVIWKAAQIVLEEVLIIYVSMLPGTLLRLKLSGFRVGFSLVLISLQFPLPNFSIILPWALSHNGSALVICALPLLVILTILLRLSLLDSIWINPCFLSRSRLRVKVVRSMYMSLDNLLIVDETKQPPTIDICIRITIILRRIPFVGITYGIRHLVYIKPMMKQSLY